MAKLRINGAAVEVPAAKGDTTLLWYLRDELGLTGTKYGCGTGVCGACTVHMDRVAVRACLVRLDAAFDHEITTIEGLSRDASHPLQRAWVAEQVPQCGYCQSGQIMQAAALLAGSRQIVERRRRRATGSSTLRVTAMNRCPRVDFTMSYSTSSFAGHRRAARW